MREAIGGSLLLNLVLIFAGVVVIFFVGILSYSKAYRVKNRIVESIEKYETYESKFGDEINDAIDEINPDLNNAGYDTSNPTRCDSIRSKLVDNENGKYTNSHLSVNLNQNYGYNYCVFEVCDVKDNSNKCIDPDGKHYVVVTFIRFEFPLIGDKLMIPVYGETKMLGKIYNY